MARIALVAILVSLAACRTTPQPRNISASAPRSPEITHLYLSCVQVVARGMDGLAVGYGSGTVYENGRIITAWHVIDDASFVTIERMGRTSAWIRPARVVKHSVKADLAVLDADTEGLTPTPLADFQPDRWQRCYAVGYAKGLASPTLTDGRIQDLDDEDLRYSAQGWFGSSGGGVFVEYNGRFHLVSVTQRVHIHERTGQVIEFLMLGAPPVAIHAFLRNQGGD